MFDLPTPPPPLNGFIVRGHLNQSHRFALFPCSLDNLVGQLTIQTQKQRMNIKAKHRTFCSYDRNMFIILRIWAITVVAVFRQKKNKIVNSTLSQKKVFAINFIIGSRKSSQYAQFFRYFFFANLCETIIIFHL